MACLCYMTTQSELNMLHLSPYSAILRTLNGPTL